MYLSKNNHKQYHSRNESSHNRKLTKNPSIQDTIHSSSTLNIKNYQMINNFLDTIDQKSNNLTQLKKSLSNFDRQIQNNYGNIDLNSTIKNQNIQQKRQFSFNIKPTNSKLTIFNQRISNPPKLKIPKPNTLTDKFMKLTLGCQQQQQQNYIRLIDSYDRTVNPLKYTQKNLITKSIDIRQSFKKQDKYFSNQQHNYNKFDKPKAFYDDTYYTYLKTNMKYLQNVNTNKQQINYIKKHNKLIDQIKFYSQDQQKVIKRQPTQINNIVQKIKETGGIQNTIQKMERSLKKNQIINSKINQYIGFNQTNIKSTILNQKVSFIKNQQIKRKIGKNIESKHDKSIKRNNYFQLRIDTKQQQQSKRQGSSWVQRSKSMRQKYSSQMS